MSVLARSAQRCWSLSLSRLASGVAEAPSSSSSPRFSGEIPADVIEKRFMLASGPGGQNVQKNATKVQIRVNLESAAWLSPALRDAVADRLANRVNAAGEVVIESDRTRERQLNLADAIDKLRSTIYDVQREMESRKETEEDVRLLRERAARAARIRLAEKRAASAKRADRAAATAAL